MTVIRSISISKSLYIYRFIVICINNGCLPSLLLRNSRTERNHKVTVFLAHVKDFTAYLLQVFEQILEFKIFSVDSHNVCVSEHELKS